MNCHKYTESSDFLGSLRPVRGHEEILGRLREEVREKRVEGGMTEEEEAKLLDQTNSLETKLEVIKKIKKEGRISIIDFIFINGGKGNKTEGGKEGPLKEIIYYYR